MLPYFKIIHQENSEQMHHHQHHQGTNPSKPRRSKKSAVPGVHHSKSERSERVERTDDRTDQEHHQQQQQRKNFSANFNGMETNPESIEKRTSRRYLIKEVEKCKQENEELQTSQDHLTKKNSKLKDKLTQLANYNQEMVEENNVLKTQYQELYEQYATCKSLLEEPKVCQTCIEMDQNIATIKNEYTHLRRTNQECLEDCNMLKNVVYRLNVQLERYQDKLRAHNLSIKEQQKGQNGLKEYDEPTTIAADVVHLNDSHLGHNHTPVQWGRVNTHTLAPLLNAYQEIIGEKEEIIENYEAEMVNFTGKLKEVFKENEHLHFMLGEDGECSKVLRTQLEGARVELKSTKEQNDLLIKKCALKQDKIEEILKCYEQKVDMLKRDYAVLHETYSKARAEIAALKEKNKALLEARDDFKSERQQFIPLSVHTTSVNECKKWYEELKLQYEAEKTKLETTIDNLRSQLKEFNDKLADINAEKLQIENKLKSTDRHLKKSETKYLELEHNLHEVQLSRSACRKQLNKAMNFAKDLVNEQETLLKALNQRQIENKAVKRIGTDIASRMDLLRNQLKTVQKEAWHELSTVEERIQEQDSIISSMKEEHEQEIERLKCIIKEKG